MALATLSLPGCQEGCQGPWSYTWVGWRRCRGGRGWGGVGECTLVFGSQDAWPCQYKLFYNIVGQITSYNPS